MSWQFMGKSGLYKVLSRIIEIKPGEETITLSLFFYYFLAIASFTIIKSLGEAKYLDELKPKNLPYAYMTVFLLIFVVAFHSRLQVKIQRQLLIISSLAFFILTCLLFWLLFTQGRKWLPPNYWKFLPLVYWVWMSMVIVVLNAQFWITVNDMFNPREVKRLIGFFGSGGILGGIAGGVLTGQLSKSNESYYLLFFASGLLAACVFAVFYIFSWRSKKQPLSGEANRKDKDSHGGLEKVGFKVCFDTIRKNYYLTLLALMVILTELVSTLIDWQYKSVVSTSDSIRQNMPAFFGNFTAGLSVFAFFIQLLLTSRIFKHYGIRFALLLSPLILLFCSFGIALFPVLFSIPLIYFAILLKGSDKSLSFSLGQSARELLYIPVSPELKYKAKIFIDMFLNRFAKPIGGVMLLIIFAFHGGILSVIILSCVLILVWVFLNLKVSREYTKTVKQKLEFKWKRADREVAEKVDIDYTKLVFDTLESKNRSSVLYALHLFDLIKQERLTPELKKLISYKSDEMRASSLGGLFESGDIAFFPEPDDFINEEVLGKEVKEIMSLDVYQELMKTYFEKALRDKSKEAVTTKMELAKALGLMDFRSPLSQNLEELLQDESPEVSKYAIESAAKLKRREHVSPLIRKLHFPSTREDACAALEKYGQKIVGTLADFLGDSEEDIELRTAVASVLARIGTQDAADFLSWELDKDKEDVATALIDALDRIRSEKPEIKFQEEKVRNKTAKEIKRHCQLIIELHEAESGARKEKAKKDVLKKLNVSLMNIFKLLGMIYPHEDIVKAYQNIKTGTKDSVAYAVELLDNTLKREVKDIIIPIIEDLPLEEKLKICRNVLRAFPNFKETV